MSSTSSTTIRIISELNGSQKNAILIAGFPGAGLVGSISTSYIIERLDMHQIACVDSEYISPGVIFVEGKLRHPFRLYSNKEGNVCVIVCEAPIMITGIHSVLNTVMDWAIKNSIKDVLVLDGIPVQGIPSADRQTIILGSTESYKKINKMEENQELLPTSKENGGLSSNLNRDIIKESHKNYTTFIGGISGGLLSACLSHQIPCAAILVPASSGIPDPEGAAILIESYNNIIKDKNLKINTTQLREQGQNLKKQLEQIIKAAQKQRGERAEGEELLQKGLMYG